MNKLKPILKVLEWLVFLVLLFLVFIIISPKLKIKGLPRSFIIVSGSMEPKIKTGSVVFTKELDPKKVLVGDIIAYTSPSNPKDTVLHRVLSIKSVDPLTFETKGDSNKSLDNWDVMAVGIKGKYLYSIPYIGYVGAFTRNPLGFLAIIVMPALFFILLQILNIKKAIAEEVNKKVTHALKNSQLPIILIIFLATLSSVKPAKASFIDTAKVEGITISIADFIPNDDDCDKDHKHKKDHNGDDYNKHDNNNKGCHKNDDRDKGDHGHNQEPDVKKHPKVSGSHKNHKIYLEIYDIPQNFGDKEDDNLSYEIKYRTLKSERGIEGRIYPTNLTNQIYSKELFIGSCSTEDCVPEEINGDTTIHLKGKIDGEDIDISEVISL